MPQILPFEATGHCLGAFFLGPHPAFVMADGFVHLLKDDWQSFQIHEGIVSVAVGLRSNAMITGGEDGHVCRTDVFGKTEVLQRRDNKWVTAVGISPHDNSYAYAIGRKAWVIDETGQETVFETERTIEGLAFAPKGQRIALSTYNGVQLYWLGASAAPTLLEWKGAHNGVTFSPDNRFIITTMQENALHGWRLADNQHLRMSGYPTKVKSWSWSKRGRWLATSGAAAAIVWPFTTKEGPIGKAPLELGTRATNLVTCVCCHPEEEALAIGYDDGMILFVRFSDGKEVLLRQPGESAITSMCWNQPGLQLLFGSHAGDCGIIDVMANSRLEA